MKTPSVNPKAILKSLSFLKNNLSLLVPIIITVVALLLFIPTRILRGRLHSTVEQGSARTAQNVTRLIGQVEQAAEARVLEPYITAYSNDANEIEGMMKQTTLRTPLSYEVFPDQNQPSLLIFDRFRQRYQSGVEALLASLKAGTPPTDSEIEEALKSAPKSPYQLSYGRSAPMTPTVMPSATSGRTRKYSSLMMGETDRKIVDTISLEKARSAGVYASPVDVAGYVYWEDWQFEDYNDAYRDCWYWQLGYWIAEDVAATIRTMNEGSDNALDAPVKRLMNLSFSLKEMGRSLRQVRMRGARRKEGANPIYVKAAKDGMTTPCTGRLCNDEIDVAHFSVSVIVNARDVMAFMRELCSAKEHAFRGWKGDEPVQTYKHNQITILESGTEPVESESFEHDFYRYGDATVVRLNLICEYLWMKSAYEDIKPRPVKEDLLATDDSKRR